MKVALIQMNSQADKAANLDQARGLIERAVEEERPDFVALPEMWTFLGDGDADKRAAAEPIPGGAGYGLLQELAARHRIVVHGGSLIERDGEAIYNTTVVFDRDGQELARYRKIHLFDITTPDGREFRESETFARGARIVSYDALGARIGCSICYDLRFPELYRRLAGQHVDLILVPAAFTKTTGRDHWEILLRARAIENQAYVIAPNQCGRHPGDLETYGNSMIIDPWGSVLARAGEEEQVVQGGIDLQHLREIRQQLPALKHRALEDS